MSRRRKSHIEVRFDRKKAISKWKQKLATMTARGFAEPPFASLIPPAKPPKFGRVHVRFTMTDEHRLRPTPDDGVDFSHGAAGQGPCEERPARPRRADRLARGQRGHALHH